jgi:hypothetical protein
MAHFDSLSPSFEGQTAYLIVGQVGNLSRKIGIAFNEFEFCSL